MNIKTENTYKFICKSGFEKLDGIYTVLSLQSYYDINLEDIDLFSFFYKKADKSQEEWDNDKSIYTQATFGKLEDISNSSNIIYIPIVDDINTQASILKEYPISDIVEYSRMMLNIDLGPSDDPSYMESLILSVAEIIAYSQGIKVMPRILVYDKVWLTDDEYEKIVEERAKNKRNTVNYFSEAKRLGNRVSSDGTKIIALETIINDLLNQLERLKELK